MGYPHAHCSATRRTGLTVAMRKLHTVLSALIEVGQERVYDG
ncbi:hypothetical protein LJR234_005798 [Mesorhizobium amorphae]